MGILKIEDWHDSAGVIDVVLFPRTWEKMQQQVESGELPPIEVGEVFWCVASWIPHAGTRRFWATRSPSILN